MSALATVVRVGASPPIRVGTELSVWDFAQPGCATKDISMNHYS
ncbi:hypothetical protein [Mycobacterium senriense]|nr:hypothetical protein [Mycobacterium senriense]